MQIRRIKIIASSGFADLRLGLRHHLTGAENSLPTVTFG
jgi:hypothetical protein